MPQRPVRALVIAFVAVVFFGGPTLVRLYTDWLWFSELGYPQIFTTILTAQGTLFAIVFAVAALWLTTNLRIALAAIGDMRSVFTTSDGVEVALPGQQQLRLLALAAASVLAILVGLFASNRWETWLAWLNAQPFGEVDPLLGLDVSFYVFSLPFLRLVHGLGQTLVVVAALAAVGLYLVSGNLTSGFPAQITMTPRARRHLGLLAVAFLLLLAFGAWLGRAEQLLQPSGIISGAGYADVNGRMPAALLLVAVAIFGAGLAALHAFTPRNWPIPVAVGLYLLVSVGGEVYGTVLQRFVVNPNEQVLETPYIEHNIAATRRAFSLDGVEVREISGDALLNGDDIVDNADTLDNVRLWDHQPLLDTFGQIQEIRTYYDFTSVDNDRYRIDGRLRQVMLSPRELNSASLPNRTWVNERLTFTHGYGLTLGPVNQVTLEGLPVLFIQDLPPATIPEIPIEEPSVYFGELSSDYVIVNTDTREFHYPRGDDNVFTQYDGDGGIPLGSLFNKALFALRFGAVQIVLSDDIGADSRILFNRSIRERVRTLASFLSFDQDPYMVVSEGRLFWIYDAYTISDRYPYSTPAGPGVNYIRNSVKIVIDAHHGTTTAYLADEQDPIAATYARIFPDFFKPLDEMPADLRAHVRYPEDIFALQSSMYRTYHMTQPAEFYNREDQWEVPVIDDAANAGGMQPYYTIMRLPGEPDAEFIQMLPFTPRNRDNLAAWLVARSDGENYGSLRVFQFPKQKLVFGPRQVVARIAQDQAISPQITLWNQQGSEVIWGTLMVIPLEESLIYVRPLYLRASGGRIPELRRVIVAYNNQIVMEPTLEAGLARLFGSGAAPFPDAELALAEAPVGDEPATDRPSLEPLPPVAGSLAAEAQGYYDRAIEAQRAGDWTTYGEQLRLLGDVLVRMRQ